MDCLRFQDVFARPAQVPGRKHAHIPHNNLFFRGSFLRDCLWSQAETERIARIMGRGR